jgi:hypothetical protein
LEDHVTKTIALVQAQVRDLERQLAEKKRMVNSLCELVGQPLLYAATDPVSSNGSVSIRSDEFYGKALATAVRRILEKRAQAALGAASVSEIYEALVKGGFRFDAKNAANAKRSLRISLTKNSVTFHKLPNGNYGLLEWYPNAKERELKTSGNGRERHADSTMDGDSEPVQESFANVVENLQTYLGPLLPTKPR